MRCRDVQEWMLEADLAALERREGGEGTEGTELRGHLSECADCREFAARIIAAERALGKALDATVPAGAARRAADRAVAGGRPALTWRRWGVVVPLAAAAGIVAVVLGRNGDLPGAAPIPPAPAPRFAVEAPPGTSVAVFETENPKITVVWFY